MDTTSLMNDAQSRIECALLNFNDLEAINRELASIYNLIQSDIPLAIPVSLEVVETKSLQYRIFYQAGYGMSVNSILISQGEFESYLWSDCDGWCLDDDYWDVREIARHLSKIPVIVDYPKNVGELYNNFVQGLWVFSLSNVPSFGGEPPRDLEEVISWDQKNVLVGTEVSNMEIVPRETWDNICERESTWFSG
ncbi:hypothetical protein ACJJIE_01740 [Microbulbifer sp. TRSA001]